MTVGESADLIAGNSADPNGEIIVFEWSTEQNGSATSVSFNTAGTYTATLTVTDNEGYSAIDEVIITVIAAPVIDDISSDSGGGEVLAPPCY